MSQRKFITVESNDRTVWGMLHGRWMTMDLMHWFNDNVPDIKMEEWDLISIPPGADDKVARFRFWFRDPDIATLFKLTFSGSFL